MVDNRERLAEIFSTAEKNCKGFMRRERSKIGKTVNIHGKICRNDQSGKTSLLVYGRYNFVYDEGMEWNIE